MPARRPGYAPVGEEARPILKWAGGKRQLLPALRRFYPPRFDRYVEPFLGSGAVFLDCHNRGLLQGRAVCLSDINADVIGCYGMVRDHVEAVIDSLEALEQRHRESAADHFYYEVRDGRFNRIRTGLPEGSELAASYTPELAAMLIYLNRSGYNGLFRVNSRGEFNVPAGRYEKITICDSANLRRVSGALNRPGLQLIVCRFEDALAPCGTGDFVYLDPPYAPLSRTAQFTSCPAGGFGPRRSSGFRKRSSGSPRGAPACC
jgi:DNA adenine methylase